MLEELQVALCNLKSVHKGAAVTDRRLDENYMYVSFRLNSGFWFNSSTFLSPGSLLPHLCLRDMRGKQEREKTQAGRDLLFALGINSGTHIIPPLNVSTCTHVRSVEAREEEAEGQEQKSPH